MNIGEIRQKFPQYSDIPDGELVRGLHRAHYSDMPYADFLKSIDFSEKVDPTAGMSGGQKFMAGVGKSMSDTGLGLKQLYAMGADAVSPRGNLSSLVTGKDNSRLAEVTREVSEARERDRPLMDTGAGMAGDIAGNVGMALLPGGALKAAATGARAAGTARVADALSKAGGTMLAPKTVPQALGVGAGMGVIQPAENAQERVVNTLLGSSVTGAAQVVPRALGRVLAPKTNAAAKELIDEGVTLTPGQILGGAAQRAEDGLTSVPVLGDAIKAAQRRGIESFDTVAINRSLSPIGKELPKGMKGHEAVAFAQETLGDAYDALLPRLKGALDNAAPTNALPSQSWQAARPTLRAELDGIRQMAVQGLPVEQADDVARIIDNEIVRHFTQGGLATGETLKNIESRLGKLASTFGRSENYAVQQKGDAVLEMQAALRRMVEDVNPGYGKELKAINEGYANFKRVQKAASSVGAKEGVFTPAQLHSAVKAGDRSKDKARFAVGDALMQDLTTAGKSALSPTVPDSGTPFRLANLATMGGGYWLDPMIAGSIGAGAAAYTPAVQKVIQALLVKRPELMRQLGPQIAATAPQLTGATLAIPATINANQ